MSFSIRSETAARIIQNMTPEALKSPGSVDRLVELAESDGKLSTEEKTALKGALLQFQQSGFDPVQRTRLEAYLGMSNATLRHTFAAGAQDGVIDIADAQAALKAINKDGKLSNAERMTVRSAMIAFKMDAGATAALEARMKPADGPFKDIQFKDAALANTLRGFTGVDKLGVAQVDALLASAADGTGISNTERQDLTNLYKNHGALLDTAARVKLSSALGISGLEGAPLGETRIPALDADTLVPHRKSLDFRKDADGSMLVKLTQSHGDHGWMKVNPDGTFRSFKQTGGEYPSQPRNEFEAKGKVGFENGRFVAEFTDRTTTHTTRPQGSQDTPNWNSGNRIPYSYGFEDKMKTETHPSLEGVKLFHGELRRGGNYSSGTSSPVALQKTAEGTFLQVVDGSPYSGRLPVGPDGKIEYGMWKGQVHADGRVELNATQRLSANYTERLDWSGRINGYTAG